MADIKTSGILTEKALEIILSFKPTDKFDRVAVNEILKLKDIIKKSISSLPANYQKVLELRYFSNLSSDDIATKLGIPKTEVSKIILNSNEMIKQKIRSGNLNDKDIKLKPTVNKTQQTSKKQTISKNQPNVLALIFVLLFNLALLVGFLGIGYFVIVKFVIPTASKIFKSSPEAISYIKDKLQNTQKETKIKEIKATNSLSSKNEYKLKISGSTSLLPLSGRWKNAFVAEFEKYNVDLSSTDSDKGINDLIAGRIDIANSSRPLSYRDQKKAADKGLELVENRIALDALIILLNKNNPVSELSLDDLENIFSGKIKSWDRFGNFSKQINIVAREQGSGTNDFVVQRILQSDDFPIEVTRKNSSKAVIDFVASNDSAVGFINSTNYPWNNESIKFIAIKNYENSESVLPFQGKKKLDEKALRYGDYPLSHYLYLITASDPPQKVKDFVEWSLSDEGQSVVKYAGLLPVGTED